MIIHVVNSGETLWQIASLYRVSISNIVTTNNLLDPNRLVVGQSLVIPSQEIQHTVRYGETLWQISSLYGVPIESIIQRNQISNPSLIYPNTTLIIPPRIYIVQSGDTLFNIAQRFGTTIEEIVDINQLQNPNLIYVGSRLVIPFSKPVIDVNGYTIHMGENGANIIQKRGEFLTYACPFAYIIKEDGGLEAINDEPSIKAALTKQVVPMMCITNFTYRDPGSRLAQKILSNIKLQDALLDNTITIMREKGYLGLNIDFENVYPQDRERYNEFLERAVDRMHQEGYFVSTALAPKYSSTQQGLLYEAHDYAAHGRIADFVILMTYEWGYRKGPPQAISPLNQIKRVLNYAVSVIPRNKIMLGFQVYARDWLLPHVKGQEAETFDMQEALRRAIQYGATIQFDQTTQSPYFRYQDENGREHEVWFEDARSAQAKFNTVKEYSLKGISYWVLGYPFPQNWALLRDNFRIRKF